MILVFEPDTFNTYMIVVNIFEFIEWLTLTTTFNDYEI